MLRRLIPLLIVAIGAGPEGVAMKDVVRGNNQFAFDLYGKVRAGSGNVFLSPYSISAALAMTSAGAKGETARQMAEALHLPSDGEALHSGFAQLDAQLVGGEDPRPYQLNIANALWGQQGLGYRPEFLRLTETYYRAGLHQVDFGRHHEIARETINSWVEEQTKDKIKDLIGPRDITPATDLVLTNAIYFKGTWSNPFPKLATKDEDFTTTEDKRFPVPMMHQSGSFNCFEADSIQALELPYEGNTLSMVVLLPRKVNGLGDLETGLTASKLDGWLARLSRQPVQVALPRFKLECGFELAGALTSLGMSLAFSPEADFSGITEDRKLFISAVIHKAFADVNEEGTEAAAATAVMMLRSMAKVSRPPVVFRADHPFLFLIRDVRSGSILFLGRVTNPKG